MVFPKNVSLLKAVPIDEVDFEMLEEAAQATDETGINCQVIPRWKGLDP